jgi:hypothetical protein
MIYIKVTNRLLFRNGDYLAQIKNYEIKSIFERSAVAKSTSIAMNKSGVKHIYDGEKVIIQYFPNRKQESIFQQVLGELDSAIKSRMRGQKLKYEIVDEVDDAGLR